MATSSVIPLHEPMRRDIFGGAHWLAYADRRVWL